MITVAELTCPRCKHVLTPASWHEPGKGQCAHCENKFEFIAFPALTTSRAKVSPSAAVIAEEAVCFFHAENRAEAICENCGRLLCSVCSIEFAGKKQCPSCIAASRTSNAAALVPERVLYDKLALSLALLPLIIWPATLVTAPLTVGMVFYGWKKPSSILGGHRRLRLIIAGTCAGLEMVAWVLVLIHLPQFHSVSQPLPRH